MDPEKEPAMAHDVPQQSTPESMEEPGIGARTWIRALLLIGVLPAAVLFGAAGTLRWPMGWLYLLLSLGSFAVSRFIVWRADPDVLRERGKMLDHDDTADFDRILAPLLALVGPLLISIVAGLDLRFGWAPDFAPWAMWAGVLLYVAGAAFGSWALVVNRFFSGVVRIQSDRDHHVVSSGPYALVRHPGYLGAIICYLGMVLMLGSPWGLIPFALQQVVLVVRTALEDRFLQEELPGYSEYAQRTRYRLIPGIW
jgi:protein-S-isoprenylcysteine O-methyltransferase Ste14